VFKIYSLKAIGRIVLFSSLCIGLSSMSYASSQLPSGELLQDPTRPITWRTTSTGPEQKAQSFRLNYILSANDRKYAHINGIKVSEGDTVSGARVLRITGDQVVISLGGRQKTLRGNAISGIKKTK